MHIAIAGNIGSGKTTLTPLSDDVRVIIKKLQLGITL